MCRNGKGFTLIELLVVIAIIAILAAILFPIFASAKEAGYSANCRSGMKQIGTALMLYCDDSDGRYPMRLATAMPPEVQPSDWDGAGSAGVGGLAWTLRRYNANSSIWMCPRGAKREFGAPNYTVPGGRPRSALWNGVQWVKYTGMRNTCTNYVSWAFNRGFTGGDSARGARPNEFYENYRRWLRDYKKTHPLTDEQAAGQLMYDIYEYSAAPFFSHKGGYNCMYYDGHVYFRWDPGANR